MRPLLVPLLLCMGCAARSGQTEALTLAGRLTQVDVYGPADAQQAPLVVVAHGFSRSRHRMRGWGEALSARGYYVAVPDLPYFAAHTDNAQGIVDLVQELRTRPQVNPGQLVLIGFSAGGLVTAQAATSLDDVTLWVGLDPVDSGGVATRAATDLGIPGLSLRAEPHGCNAHGNGQQLASDWAGPHWSAEVRGATHCDPESPSNAPCAWFCGASEPARAQAFIDVVQDAVDAVVRCDSEAIRRLDLAGSDPRLTDRVDDGLVQHLARTCP